MATNRRALPDHFADLPGPRIALKCDHEFLGVILIVAVATVGGADDFVSAAAFARAKGDWFRDRLGLRRPNGIPSHDALNRAFAILAPEPFQKCFFGFVEPLSGRLKLEQIPIDGKAVRGPKRKTLAGHRTAHIVSATAPPSDTPGCSPRSSGRRSTRGARPRSSTS